MELVRHPVHRALTRPQMFAGVTYNYFIINLALTTELFLITGSWWALPAALRRGENVIGVALGNGWFNVGTRAAWDFDRAPWRATRSRTAGIEIRAR